MNSLFRLSILVTFLLFALITYSQEPFVLKIQVNPGENGAIEAGGLSATLNTTLSNGETIAVPSFYEITKGENAQSIANGLMGAFLEYLNMNAVECVGEIMDSSSGGSLINIVCFNATNIEVSFFPATLAAANGITVVASTPNTPTPTATVCPPGTESTLIFNVTSEGAKETSVLGIKITAFPISGTPVTIQVNHTINTGDSTATLANGLRTSISQALSNAGLDCTVNVRTTQFENVLQIEVTCRCVVDLFGEFTTPETASGTGITIINDPTPTPTNTNTHTPTHSPTPTNTPTNTHTPTPTPTPTNTLTPSYTFTPVSPTYTFTPTPRIFGEEILGENLQLDIHPIQVVQDPRDNTLNEDIAIIKNKATMVRVFLIWSPPDPTSILNVECVLIADGVLQRQMADIHYTGGRTFVFPAGSDFGGSAPDFLARDAYNFTFPATKGHHPSGAFMNVSASLRIDGNSVAFQSEEYELRNFTDQSGNGDSRMTFAFHTIETTDKPLLSGSRQVISKAREQFDRMVAVYPAPHTQASYSVTTEPHRLAGGLGRAALWLLAQSFHVPGREHIDRYVLLSAGRPPRTRSTPEPLSVLEDWQDRGTEGFTVNSTILLVTENAPTFTTAHENGHVLRLGPTYLLGLGHNNVPSGDGWDVREITGRRRPYKPDQSFNALMFSTANDDNDGWISDDEYKELIEKMTSLPAAKVAHPQQVSLQQEQSVIFVSGFIGETETEIDPFFTTTGKISQPYPDSDYAAQCLDANGNALSEHKFLIEIAPGIDPNGVLVDPDDPHEESRTFGFFMPFPANTSIIQIVKSNAVLAQRTVSANPPSVAILSITKLNESGWYEVSFTATDADNDVLYPVASYTHNGEDFQALNINWIEEGSRFTFDASNLPGGSQGRVRIAVTDGVHSALALSDPISLPDQAPEVFINTPTDFSPVSSGEIVVLNGHGYDFEDGMVENEDLVWTSDLVSAPLGTGEILRLPSLPVGIHTITLRTTDNSNNPASESIKITVVDSVNTPDVQLSNLAAASLDLITNATLLFSADVIVAGTNEDVRFTVTAFNALNQIIHTQNFDEILPGNQNIELFFDTLFDAAGDYRIALSAELLNRNDANPGNNTAEINLTIFAEDGSFPDNTPTPTPSPTPTIVPVYDDLVLSQGFGGGTLITVRNFDPNNGAITRVLRSFLGVSDVFRNTIGGGSGRTTYVSTGDVNNDGTDDLVISFGIVADSSALFPNIVLVRDGFSRQIIGHSFHAFPTGSGNNVNYNGGEVRTAVGDFLGIGSNQIAATQGFGGNGVIRLYRFTGLPAPNSWAIAGQFNGLPDNAQAGNANGGLTLAAGDLNGDGKDELLVAQTNSPSSQTIFHALAVNSNGTISVRYPYAGFIPAFRGNGGLELTVADLNGDGQTEIIAASKGNSREFGDDRDTAPLNLISIIEPVVNNGELTGFSRPANSVISVFTDEINPSGTLSIATGKMNGNVLDGEEIIIGTGALIQVANGVPQALLPAPESRYRIIKIHLLNSSVQGISNVLGSNRGFPAFTGNLNPSSGGIWIGTLAKP